MEFSEFRWLLSYLGNDVASPSSISNRISSRTSSNSSKSRSWPRSMAYIKESSIHAKAASLAALGAARTVMISSSPEAKLSAMAPELVGLTSFYRNAKLGAPRRRDSGNAYHDERPGLRPFLPWRAPLPSMLFRRREVCRYNLRKLTDPEKGIVRWRNSTEGWKRRKIRLTEPTS